MRNAHVITVNNNNNGYTYSIGFESDVIDFVVKAL